MLLLNKFICFYIIIFIFDRLTNQHILNDYKSKTKLTFYTESYFVQIFFLYFSQVLLLANINCLLYSCATFQILFIVCLYFKNQYNLITVLVVALFFSINITLIKPSVLNFTILMEIFSLLLVSGLLLSKKVQITYKKTFYIVLITTNIIVLSFLVFNQWVILFTTGCWDFEVVFFLLEYKNTQSVILFTYFILLLKLGLFLGPKYNSRIYLILDKTTLTFYMFYYYVIFILISIVYLNFIKVTPLLTIFVWLGIFITNRSWLSNQNNSKLLFYWSNQISLFYLQLLIL